MFKIANRQVSVYRTIGSPVLIAALNIIVGTHWNRLRNCLGCNDYPLCNKLAIDRYGSFGYILL